MSDDDGSSVNAAIKSVGTGPAAQEAYRDLLKPAFLELSPSLRAMAQCVAIALLPLKAVVWSYDKILDWLVPNLSKKLEQVPPSEIKSPDITVAGPVFLYLPFVEQHEELREMYAKLLATSMTNESRLVHPAFVHVVQQLSPADARILKYISTRHGGEKFMIEQEHDDAFDSDSPDLYDQFEGLCVKAGVDPSHSGPALDNLLRLRVLYESSVAKGEFQPAGHNRYGSYNAQVSVMTSRAVVFSPFGQRFLKACV